jgi:hypothetical protein
MKPGLPDRMQAIVLAAEAVAVACGIGLVTPAEPGG